MFQALCNTGKGLFDIGGILKGPHAARVVAGIACCFFVFGYSPVEGSSLQPTHVAANKCDIIWIDGVPGCDGSVDVKEQFVGKVVVFPLAISAQRQTVRYEGCDKSAYDTCGDCYIHQFRFRKRDHYVPIFSIAFVSGIVGGLAYSFIYWAWTSVNRRIT